LLQLAGMYCDAINEGALPNISNAFTAVIVARWIMSIWLRSARPKWIPI
jgi:hypothetical protein